MNHYIDTEFLEGTQRETFPINLFRKETKPTIDLISVGIVAEDSREYYAISKDFNLKEAWNRHEFKSYDNQGNLLSKPRKIYWIRENVLKSIFLELCEKENIFATGKKDYFTFKNFKGLLNKYGKTNKQIAREIKCFVANVPTEQSKGTAEAAIESNNIKPKFYAYYADYDWTVFCWLFGTMIDLPKGFPMYCVDLKQELDRKAIKHFNSYSLKEAITGIKELHTYPKQTNEHNALADANWNKRLHEFLKEI